MNDQARPLFLALFQKRLEGDFSLLELARLRFRQAGLAAEFYAATPEELEWLWSFNPLPESPAIAHLPRHLDLFNSQHRDLVIAFAVRFAGRLRGLVVHDQPALETRPTEYHAALTELASRLQTIARRPLLFLEYAAGVEPEQFAHLFTQMADAPSVSACLDVGHVGLRQVRWNYAQKQLGQDICALKYQPAQNVLADVQTAVATALPTVLHLIEALHQLGKPLHFHLHDGHPLSTVSRHGVSDHLSFLARIPIPFQDRAWLAPMFGPDGLRHILQAALAGKAPAPPSFTLEIHETDERRPLADAQALFRNWRDRTNAEKMNHWLAVIAENYRLVRQILDAPGAASACGDQPAADVLGPRG